MKQLILDQELLELFPDTSIGVLVCRGLDNHVKEQDRFAPLLRECEKESVCYTGADEWLDNPVVASWREAFYKFKTKKGARCSIEALLKRVKNGGEIGCINPLVDIYNAASLKFGLPIGGENVDEFQGDMHLTIAKGGEAFITYGSDKDEPALEGEVIYADDYGAICRCWNWRECVRTMLTEDVTNAVMVVELSGLEPDGTIERLDKCLDWLADKIESELGGTVRKAVLNGENKAVEISGH